MLWTHRMVSGVDPGSLPAQIFCALCLPCVVRATSYLLGGFFVVLEQSKGEEASLRDGYLVLQPSENTLHVVPGDGRVTAKVWGPGHVECVCGGASETNHPMSPSTQ